MREGIFTRRIFSRVGLLIMVVSSLFPLMIHGQNKSIPVVTGQVIEFSDHDLDHQFSSHRRLQINTQALHTLVHNADFENEIEWHLGTRKITTTLFEHDLRAENYVLEIHTEAGIKTIPRGPCTTYRGWSAGGGEVRLSITATNISGFFTATDGTVIYIQPLGTLLKTTEQNFVIYTKEEVINDENQLCGSTDSHRIGSARINDQPHSPGRMASCVGADVAIAADYSMFTAYGSNVTTLVNHLENLKNMQEAIYAVYPVEFSIVKTTIITQSGQDPWTASPDAGALLDNFCCWAGTGSSSQLGCSGSNNFGVDHDLGELWTNRNFDGNTVGVAWIGTVCNSMFRYSVNEDLSSVAANLVLISHEQGHNFGAGHVSGVWIMNSFVDTDAEDFHSSSQNTITNKINSVSCLADCGSTNCDDIITVTSGTANSSHDASIMIHTSGSLLITSPVIYNAPTVEIISPFEVGNGTVFEITTDGCNN